MPIAYCINIASQIASGLQAAHKKGIVHRDIKSANIMITCDDKVKIMDFGLAKIGAGAQLTKDHSTLGTAAYMSPEQASGDEVDQRSDIWSFGVVMYEILSGQLPFKGDYEQAVVYSIMNEQVEPLTGLRAGLPMELERIVNKSLAKSPDERYQQMDEMLTDLKSLKRQLLGTEGRKVKPAKVPDQRNSIAVLPFVNVSSDQENEYFSDGITEELINALSKLKEIKVVSRTSVFQFKGKPYDIREIGKSLNVSTALEGSVRKAGDKLRISTQLINVMDGCHMWSESFNREMKDVFAIQEEISNAIVSALKIELSGGTDIPVVKRNTNNLEAYDLYLKGRFFWNNRQFSELKKAKLHFEKAIKIDSEYALAHAGLADYYNMMAFYAYSAPKEVIPKAKRAALRALEIDDTLAEAHSALAYARWTFDWDMESSESGFKRAIELNPNYSTAHMWYSNFLVMTGRAEEGFVEIEKALTLEMNPKFLLARHILTLTYEQQSKYMDAIKEGIKIREYVDSAQYIASLAYAYAKSSKTGEATQLLEELLKLSKDKYVSGYHIAAIYSGLNQIDSAFSWLEKAIEERSTSLIILKVDPMFKNLQSDSRFNEILKKIGLVK